MSHLYCRRLPDERDPPTRGNGTRRAFSPREVESKYAPDKVCDIRHIRLDLKIDLKGKKLGGRCSITLRPYAQEVSSIDLDSVDLTIENVAGKTRGPLPHDVLKEKLRIEFPTPLRGGEEETLVIDYAALEPRRGLYFVSPDESYPGKPLQAWTQGEDEDARYWFPCFDAPHQKSTSEMVVTVPSGFLALSNGKLLAVKDDPAEHTRSYHWYQEVPHTTYLVSLVVGEFSEITDRADGLPVQYYVPRGREEDGRRSFGKTPAMLSFFSKKIGVPYPYAKYAQVTVSEFIFGGMENTSVTTLTDLTLHDQRAHLDFSSDGLVAHELAHQWFGDLVTCRHWSHAWLNEGFATYFDALFKEHDRGEEEFRYELKLMADEYFKEDRQRYRRPIVTHQFRDPIDLFDRHLYEKGALVLHMLRYELGEDLFWKSIRLYVEDNSRRNVETIDLQRAVEVATGRNLESFFHQWVFQAGYPELKVNFDWNQNQKVATLKASQIHEVKDDTPLFSFPVDVRFQGEDWAQVRRITINKKEQAFYFPLEAKPSSVAFDPKNWILKRLQLDFPKEMLLYQLRHDPDVMVRIAAVQALSEKAGREETLALGEALEKDGFWGVQKESAKTLGKIRTPLALKELLEKGLPLSHPKARRAAVEALGEFRDDGAAQSLGKILEGDQSYFVEAEAASSLGRTKAPLAFDALAKSSEKNSWNEVIRASVFRGLSSLEDDRAIPLLSRYAKYGAPQQARYPAIRALGKLGGVKAEVPHEILDLLFQLADESGFRTTMAVADALEETQSSKALSTLERMRAKAVDGRLKTRIDEATESIRSGRKQADEIHQIRDDLESLREENHRLKDRLDQWKAASEGKTRAAKTQ